MKNLLISGVVAVALAGCASIGKDLPLRSPEEVGRVRNPGTDEEYLLGKGDEVSLAIYGEPELSRNYTLGADGVIDVPLIGRIPATNMSIVALTKAVEARLRGDYLRNAAVAGSIVTYRPFYILGEVNRPGEYPYRPNLTLDDAVALAGGYTYRAQPDWVLIKGERETSDTRVQVAPNLAIRPGDTVRIVERFF